MKLIPLAILALTISCNSSDKEADTKIQDLQNQVQDLQDKQAAAEATATDKENQERAAAEAKEVQDKKEDIIQDIREGRGLIVRPKIKWEMGGFTDGSMILENSFSGIVFQLVTVEYTIRNKAGTVFREATYEDFVNLKPGELRERTIDPINRGELAPMKVTRIQSKWLTNGKVIEL